MIKRVFEITLDGGESPMYYCTVCNRPYKALHEANEHAKFCGKSVPTQPVFRSYTTAATFEEDDDTQVYAVPWQGLTDEEINAIYEQAEALVHDSWVGSGTVGLMFPITLYKMFEAALKKKNA